MNYLKNWQLKIAGSGDIDNQLKDLAAKNGLQDRVLFYGRVMPSRLPELAAGAGFGISLEENLGLNYYYALPNKLFDYIQARIPVITSGFPEMKHIVESYNIGFCIQQRNPEKLAQQITEAYKNKNIYDSWKNNLSAAAHDLCWENERQELLRLFASFS
jgi:glycosyltransferase involved in cell wall biosynthesis